VLSGELGVSIVKSKFFDANFIGSPPFWADGTEVHRTALMCVDVVESKYQLLNKCKLLFDLVVHQQQHLHCFYIVFGSILVHLAKFERNFTKRNFYFVTQFMSKCSFYFETEGVHVN
jgi:hypothetical protein